MKNKVKIILKLLFIFNLSFFNAFSNDVLIDADEVNINQKGNVIEAIGSVNIKDKDNIQIKGQNAKYDKIVTYVKILRAYPRRSVHIFEVQPKMCEARCF